MRIDSMDHTMYLDVDKKELENLEIGAKMSLTVEGTIYGLKAPTPYSKKERETAKKEGYPLNEKGSITITVDKQKIEHSNDFTKLSENGVEYGLY